MIFIYNNYILIGRDTAVYGDGGTVYSYASVDIEVMEWVEPLITIKNYVEKLTGFQFNVCLLNHYASGKEGIGWHSDKEEAGKEAPIASLSLGQKRVFSFREKKGPFSMSLELTPGSLLVMGKGCQEKYLHCLEKDPLITGTRINLTFRWHDRKSNAISTY